jgi:hypothetical protein
MTSVVVYKVLGSIAIVNTLIVIFALFSLWKASKIQDISKFRFISLVIVLIQMLLLITHWIILPNNTDSYTRIVISLVQEIVKYTGFYCWVYFFTAQAVEILSNKDNDFIYYTKLGLISTTVIQTVHWVVTIILLVINGNDPDDENKKSPIRYFCQNNLWVMMRFLGLAVTFGFIFIGWRIQQSILNPLLSKKRRQTFMSKVKNKKSTKSQVARQFIDSDDSSDDDWNPGSPRAEDRISCLSNNMDGETTEEIEMKIRRKKKQLRIMWFILIVILFIGFYEMIYSALQRLLSKREWNSLIGNKVLDGILIFFSRLIGLLLWTWPLIYVYWAREYIYALRQRSHHQAEFEEESGVIDELFNDKQPSLGKIRCNFIANLDSTLTKFMIQKGTLVGKSNSSREITNGDNQ